MRFELRPMGVGEILDRALRVYLLNLARLLPIALVVLVPLALLALALEDAGRVPATGDPSRQVGALGAVLATAAANVLGWGLLQGGLIQVVSDIYLGNPTGIQAAFGRGFRRILPMLGATLLSTIAIAVGFVLLIVPGIIWTAALFCVNAAVVLEGKSVLGSFQRSKDLTAGFRKKVLWIIGLSSIIGWVWGALVGAAAGWLDLTTSTLTVLTHAANAFFTPFHAVVTILLYYDLRIRKEAFDLEVLAREMGRPTA
ncbi:MAG: hypothetical protein L0323_19280 [Planctomycetes bacterium]|nr:hypothetical protein [Planctomycetota bacterium]